ncbi:MAG: T9SS type A sorting domain-containing protein [Flavobacteriales bacterium]
MLKLLLHINLSAFFLIFLQDSSGLLAQAPFAGGSAEGHASVTLQNSDCDALDANPFQGGGSSNIFHDTLINTPCKPEIFNIYNGGTGNGFAHHALQVSDCDPMLISIFSGGLDDGFSQAAIIVSECNSVLINIYGGGIDDGFSQDALVISSCESVIINIFEGGTDDGFAHHVNIVSACDYILLNIFSGGNGQGFAHQSLINEFCPTESFFIFSGGQGDGFDQMALIVSDCQEVSLSIFSGGIDDGHAFATITSSLQFLPFDSTLVCVNSDAVISLPNAGSGLQFQWQVSINNGLTYSNLSEANPYSGVETDELTISNVNNSFNGLMYRVVVTNPGCITLTSPPTTIGVGPQPIAGSLNKIPDVPHVCQGVPVAASFTSGFGGIGLIQDVFEYSTDFGSLWNDYAENHPINTTSIQGIGVVKIRTYRTASGQGCANSDPAEVEWTVAGEGFWIGVTSADWNTQSNWGCGVIPDITTDVTIPQVQLGNNQPNIFNSPNAYARNLTIEPNASVTTFFGNTLELHGDLINNGINSLGIGNVLFAGNTTQHISGSSVSDISYLRLNNSAAGFGLRLQQHVNVSDEFQIFNGMVDLNGYDVDLGPVGVLIGENEISRITGQSGEIKSTLTLAANTNYTNIKGLGIDLQTSSIAPGFTVLNRGHQTYSVDFDNYGIDRYFRIEPTVNSGLNVTMRMYYFDAELSLGNHVEAFLIPWRSADNGLTWEGQFFPLNLSNDEAANWVQQTGIDAFSLWTLSDWQNEPLPIQLLHFSAVPNGNVVDLEWITASEINNHYFTVERSADASQFDGILQRLGAGNSNIVLVYQDVDYQPLQGISYYRLKQTDFDGSFSYSQIVPVFFGSSGEAFQAFVDVNRDFQLIFGSSERALAEIRLFDAAGRLVLQKHAHVQKGENQIKILNPGLASGVYMLQLHSGNSLKTTKLFVR